MRQKLTVLISLICLVSLAFAGAAFAAGPDPKAAPAAGQGTLEIRNLDHEITVAYAGTGYTLHRFGTLRLAADAGQNDFDYFCDGHKYFMGDVKVTAGKTTVVTLRAAGCASTTVSAEAASATATPPPGEFDAAHDAGYMDGYFCRPRNNSYSSDPALQAEYDRGYDVGYQHRICT